MSAWNLAPISSYTDGCGTWPKGAANTHRLHPNDSGASDEENETAEGAIFFAPTITSVKANTCLGLFEISAPFGSTDY